MQSRAFNDLDVLVLGVLVSPNLVGIYAVAWSVGKFLTIFDNAVRSTLFLEISFHDGRDDGAKVARLVTDALTYGGMLLIPGLVGGVLLGVRLLRIYVRSLSEERPCSGSSWPVSCCTATTNSS